MPFIIRPNPLAITLWLFQVLHLCALLAAQVFPVAQRQVPGVRLPVFRVYSDDLI